MKFDSMLIGFLLFSLVVVGGVFIIADLNKNYGSLGTNISNESYGSVYNTIDEIYGVGEDAEGKTLSGDISDTESWQSMTKGSYSAVRLVTGTFDLFNEISNEIAIKLKIPTFIVTILMAAFTVSIIFAVIYMIFRFIPR